MSDRIGICELCNKNPCTCLNIKCKHENVEYQPEELDTNAAESMYCGDCGKDLEVPDQDWDLMRKGK
tara:strand:+ start:216 stop:416 length:201 start_codon:yes stop_codon:yes gene_type:complete